MVHRLEDDQAAAASPQPPPRKGVGRVVRAVGILGRVLVVAGLMLLFYTVYLLWGTGIHTKQAQNELAREIEARPVITTEHLEGGEIPPARPESPPSPGDALFAIVIPDIGLRSVVVSGVGAEELKSGPGHFPDSAYPGEPGNVPISGHRTTYGAPFYRVNELAPGAIIDIESGPARYRYRVREQKIVTPDQVDVVMDHGRDELTLTTCHPRFSAAQRLIVHADYEGASLLAGPAVGGAERPTSGPSGVPAPPAPVPFDVLVLAAIALAALLGSMGLSKRFRPAAIYSTIVIFFGSGLWFGLFPWIVSLMPPEY